MTIRFNAFCHCQRMACSRRHLDRAVTLVVLAVLRLPEAMAVLSARASSGSLQPQPHCAHVQHASCTSIRVVSEEQHARRGRAQQTLPRRIPETARILPLRTPRREPLAMPQHPENTAAASNASPAFVGAVAAPLGAFPNVRRPCSGERPGAAAVCRVQASGQHREELGDPSRSCRAASRTWHRADLQDRRCQQTKFNQTADPIDALLSRAFDQAVPPIQRAMSRAAAAGTLIAVVIGLSSFANVCSRAVATLLVQWHIRPEALDMMVDLIPH